MTEAKKFMRYVLPGLVFVLELAVACSLSKVVEVPSEFNASAASWLGIVLGVLVSSGALGYIFSMIYFTFTRLVDHSNSFSTINNCCNHIVILKSDRRMLPPSEVGKLKRRDKMVVVNQIWHWLIGHDEGMRAIENYSEKVNDIMHGLGATFVATLAALAFWGWLVLSSNATVPFARPIFVVWLMFSVLMFFHYNQLRRYYTEFYNSVIITAINATDQLDNGLRIILKGGEKH